MSTKEGPLGDDMAERRIANRGSRRPWAAVSAADPATVDSAAIRGLAAATAADRGPPPVRATTTVAILRSKHHGPKLEHAVRFFPPPQDLPVHGVPEMRRRSTTRISKLLIALRLRARQDRAEPHHRRLRQRSKRETRGAPSSARRFSSACCLT